MLAIGDYNFNYDFNAINGNQAFQLFTKGDVWKWLRPAELIDSNWSDTNPRLPDDQRTDRYPDSILDFIFVAGPAQHWQTKSWVVVRPGDFPDSDETSDHHPVAAAVGLAVGQLRSLPVWSIALAGIGPPFQKTSRQGFTELPK